MKRIPWPFSVLHIIYESALLCAVGRARRTCLRVRIAGKQAPRDPASATAVTGEDIDRTPSVPVEQLMRASSPASGLRGRLTVPVHSDPRDESVQSSNEPLYIIDGTHSAGNERWTNRISPNDIASIQVLKDAAATTMYGVRGANA